MWTGQIPVACLNLAQLLDESVLIILCGLEETCAEANVQLLPLIPSKGNAGGNTQAVPCSYKGSKFGF